MRRFGAIAVVVGMGGLSSCILLTDLGELDSATRAAADAGSSDVITPTEASSSSSSSSGEAGASDASNKTSYAAAVMADGPIAYLRLEETQASVANDSSGKNHPAVVSGSFDWGKEGASDKALGLDQAAIDFGGPMGDFIGNAPFTLEAWANVNTADMVYRHLWTKNLVPQSAPRQAYGVYIRQDVIVFERVVNDTFRVIETDYSAHMNRWTHVVVTYDGQMIGMFLNGQLIDSKNDTRSIPSIASVNLFAGTKDTGYGWTRGVIDEVAVYDKALTADRVKAHFDLGPK